MESSKSQDINLIKKLFKAKGNMNLLDNYRGQKVTEKPVLIEFIKFLLVVLFWIGTSFAAGSAFFVFVELILSKILPSPIINVLRIFEPLLVILTFIPPNAMFLVLLERKLLALLTTRLGPNRVGPNGVFQTFADALKLLFKEDIRPKDADKVLFSLAPIIFFAPSVIMLLPILSVIVSGAGLWGKLNIEFSLLFVIATSSIGIIGLILAGWASNNKYALLGSLRSVAQAISYEIPLILSLVAFILISGNLNLKVISDGQSQNFLDWNILAGGALMADNINWFVFPFQLIVFLGMAFMFYFCSLAEVNRIPFDLPEAESELVSGYNTEYSGMKFALFFLAEYTNLFITSMLFSILFLGSTHSGIFALDQFFANTLKDTILGDLTWITNTFIILTKAYLMVALAIWIRATLPRFRSDQLMGLAWKVLIPISLFLILLAAICKTFTN